MANEVGKRTPAELAASLYPTPGGKAGSAALAKGEEPPRLLSPYETLRPLRSEQEYAQALHPEVDENLAKITDTGDVEDLIRSRDGEILHRAFCRGECEKLAAAHSDALYRADLREMKLGDMPGANLEQADLRGARLKSLRDANLTGAIVDEDTDVSEADFFLCRMDLPTWESLRRCRGAGKAKNLTRPRS